MIAVEFIHKDDGTVVIVDNRVFSAVVENQINSIKESTKNEILSKYPEYKQRNAAMGILSTEEELQIKRGIESIRNYSDILEQQVYSIVWNGAEKDRKRACDEVQSIYWNYSSDGIPAPSRYTSYQFFLRFTSQERALFRQSALINPAVADFQQLAQAAQEIIVTDPVTIAGMNYLVSLGLLTDQRKNEILT